TGKQILTGDHAVLIVPRTRLVAGTYSVRLVQSKQAAIAWSFVVNPRAAPPTTPPTTAPTTTPPPTPPPPPTDPASSPPPPTAPPPAAPPTAAPTTPPPTTSATSSTAAPIALDPEVTIDQTACSFGARASGSADLTVSNPVDGAGPATYSVTVGTKTGTATAS